MKNSVLIWGFFVLFALTTLSGCMSAPGMTSKEVHRRHVDSFRQDMYMLQDDFDAVWMIDRPSRLTRYSTR